jgi:hypothetical protein
MANPRLCDNPKVGQPGHLERVHKFQSGAPDLSHCVAGAVHDGFVDVIG